MSVKWGFGYDFASGMYLSGILKHNGTIDASDNNTVLHSSVEEAEERAKQKQSEQPSDEWLESWKWHHLHS